MAGNGKLSQAVSDFISIVDENLRTQQFTLGFAAARAGIHHHGVTSEPLTKRYLLMLENVAKSSSAGKGKKARRGATQRSRGRDGRTRSIAMPRGAPRRFSSVATTPLTFPFPASPLPPPPRARAQALRWTSPRGSRRACARRRARA